MVTFRFLNLVKKNYLLFNAYKIIKMSKKETNSKKSLRISNFINYTFKFLSVLSPKLVLLFVAKLFTTPIKHKTPKREVEMVKKSKITSYLIPGIQSHVVTYEFGSSSKKVLLVHGWSGRGTQLVKIAEELVRNGYSVISFDAPAHGKSSGKSTIMTEFIATVAELNYIYGPFNAAIGHSLGAMTLLNAAEKKLNTNCLVTIGSGDKIIDILDDFVHKLKLKKEVSQQLNSHFEKKFNEVMENYAGHNAAKKVKIPVLVIHDNNDLDVPLEASLNIHRHLKNGELFVTKGLGHRKILGDTNVLQKIIQFVEQHN